MTSQTKINLKNMSIVLGMAVILASVVGSAFLTYDNARSAASRAVENSAKIQVIETKQARFEGMIDERTKNTARRVEDIYDIVKDWSPDGKN